MAYRQRDENFEQMIARHRKAKADRRYAAMIAFEHGKGAIRGLMGSIPIMAIKSGETDPRSGKRQRVTFFGQDGPRGHESRNWDEEIADAAADYLDGGHIEPMMEDEVIAWTSTEEYRRGAEHVAFVQAINSYSWLAQKAHVDFETRQEVNSEAHRIAHRDGNVAATEYLARELAKLPKENPRIAGFVLNPPWVTEALANSYETLEAAVQDPKWMPRLSGVSAKGNKLIAKLSEYGCGAYGCVLPTGDSAIVLKVTTDDTEAMFAEKLAPDLVAPICVDYPMVAELNAKHDGRTIYLLWRESADHVGEMAQVLGDRAVDLVSDQHEAAQMAYEAVYRRQSETMRRARVSFWLEMCERMARQMEVPALKPIGAGLVEIYERQRILFGDLHAGNFGMVTRDGKQSWVITDPGNIAVVDDL